MWGEDSPRQEGLLRVAGGGGRGQRVECVDSNRTLVGRVYLEDATVNPAWRNVCGSGWGCCMFVALDRKIWEKCQNKELIGWEGRRCGPQSELSGTIMELLEPCAPSEKDSCFGAMFIHVRPTVCGVFHPNLLTEADRWSLNSGSWESRESSGRNLGSGLIKTSSFFLGL